MAGCTKAVKLSGYLLHQVNWFFTKVRFTNRVLKIADTRFVKPWTFAIGWYVKKNCQLLEFSPNGEQDLFFRQWVDLNSAMPKSNYE